MSVSSAQESQGWPLASVFSKQACLSPCSKPKTGLADALKPTARAISSMTRGRIGCTAPIKIRWSKFLSRNHRLTLRNPARSILRRHLSFSADMMGNGFGDSTKKSGHRLKVAPPQEERIGPYRQWSTTRVGKFISTRYLLQLSEPFPPGSRSKTWQITLTANLTLPSNLDWATISASLFPRYPCSLAKESSKLNVAKMFDFIPHRAIRSRHDVVC